MNEPHRRGGWTIKLNGPMAGELSGGPWKLVPQTPGPGGGT
jgi:hypothetical protein